MSIDCKATVKIGDFTRGGRTRGDNQACDHDFGSKEKYTPCGIVDEDSGHLHLVFGSDSKTSDFIVDTLQSWWNDLTPDQQQATGRIQIKVDNGSESSGLRTQFLKRMVEFADFIGKPIQLLYYPPYHSKYNPTLAVLGDFGKTLEWSQADRCSHHAPMGKKYDMERPSSRCQAEPQNL